MALYIRDHMQLSQESIPFILRKNKRQEHFLKQYYPNVNIYYKMHKNIKVLQKNAVMIHGINTNFERLNKKDYLL